MSLIKVNPSIPLSDPPRGGKTPNHGLLQTEYPRCYLLEGWGSSGGMLSDRGPAKRSKQAPRSVVLPKMSL